MFSKVLFSWFFCLIMISGIEAKKTRKATSTKPGTVEAT